MSLINNMLTNLEDRQAYLADERDFALQGLSSINDENFHDPGPRTRLYTSLILAALVIAGGGYLYLSDPRLNVMGGDNSAPALMDVVHDYDLAASIPAAREEADAEPGESPSAFTLKMDYALPVTAAGNSVAGTAPAAGPALLAFDIENFEGVGTVVRLRLREVSDYRLYKLDSPERVVVEFEDRLELPATLPAPVMTGMVSSIAAVQDSESRTMVILDLQAPGTVDLSEIREMDGGFELTVYLSALHETATAAQTTAVDAPAVASETVYPQKEGSMQLNRKTSTPVELLNRGIGEYRNGKVAEGLELVSQALALDTVDVTARSTLVNMLIEQKAYADAIRFLDDGIAQVPGHFQWRVLKAKLLVSMNRGNEAVELLAGAGPAVADDPDYYAFLAALLQKLGRNEEAAVYYRNVVNVRHDNGVWWMGLGISLERINQPEQASQAYQRSLADKAMTLDVRNFVRDRLAVLGRL